MSNVLLRIFRRARGFKGIGQVSALVLALSIPVVAPVGAATITIGTSDPNLPNCIPLGCPSGFDVSRYQQVYSASAFSGIGAPIVITEISFFKTTQTGIDLGDATFTIFLSSTSAVVNSLDNNVGGDNTQFAILTATGGAAPVTTILLCRWQISQSVRSHGLLCRRNILQVPNGRRGE